MPEIPLETPVKPDIYSFNFDKNLNRNIEVPLSPLIYDIVKDQIQIVNLQVSQLIGGAGGIAQSGSVSIVNIRIAGEAFSKNDALYLQKSDGRVLRTDATASDEKIYNFIGFAAESSGGAASRIKVYESGIVPGFSGLTTGSWYFLTNTVGAINAIPGTFYKKIGLAISTTELFIAPDTIRLGYATGTFGITNLGANPGTTVVTLGFRPTLIIGHAALSTTTTAPSFETGDSSTVKSTWGYNSVFFSGVHRGFSLDWSGTDTTANAITNALTSDEGAGRGSPKITITTLTDTGCTVRFDNDGTNVDAGARWELIFVG